MFRILAQALSLASGFMKQHTCMMVTWMVKMTWTHMAFTAKQGNSRGQAEDCDVCSPQPPDHSQWCRTLPLLRQTLTAPVSLRTEAAEPVPDWGDVMRNPPQCDGKTCRRQLPVLATHPTCPVTVWR